jgi:hypothetical protein
MVVNDLDLVRIGTFPPEAHAPLIVDSYTVLAEPITAELLQGVPGRDSQVLEGFRRVDGHELAEHHTPEFCREAPYWLSPEQPFGVAITEGLDHRS